MAGRPGMPRPTPRPSTASDQGIVRDERGQKQPRDRARPEKASHRDSGDDASGDE